MRCIYTPYDIAIFFTASDFEQRKERSILHNIWKNDNALVPDIYRTDEVLFRRRVYAELSKFDGTPNDLDELNLLMRDMGESFYIKSESMEQDIIESYFKIIKLELKYIPNLNHRKVKLRRLLKRFNYKRRSVKLVTNIKQTLSTLELKTYLKDYVLCDIADISIDDMIMIRL